MKCTHIGSCRPLSLLIQGPDGENGRAAPTPPQRLSPPAPWRPAATGNVQLEPAATGGPKRPRRPSGRAGGHPSGRRFHSRPWT